MKIWKFEFRVDDRVQIEMPRGAKILSVGCQSAGETLCVWAIVDPDDTKTWRTFHVRGTGHSCDGISMAEFIGTVQTPSGLVWHVFLQ